jgi:hypothetical protein
MRTLTLLALLIGLAACAPAASPPVSPLDGLPLVPGKPNLLFFFTDG